MTENQGLSRPFLPVEPGDRVLLFLVALPFAMGSVLGLCVMGLARDPGPPSVTGSLGRLLLSELFSVTLVVSVLSLTWAVAAPRFLEGWLRKTSFRLVLASIGAVLGAVLWLVYVAVT